MSTSSEITWQTPQRVSAAVHPFNYPPIGAPTSPTSIRWMPQVISSPDSAADSEELQRREQCAREEGLREGELRARIIFEEALAAERRIVTQAIDNFSAERTSYYARVEAEVVQLALAIARKVIHREVQLDPLLLTGVVEVALRQMDSNTRVLMRIHPAHAPEWRAYCSRELSQTIEIVEDTAVGKDRCVIQTTVGSTEIGIEPQLKEIENGFFDLLAQRPTTTVTRAVQ